ncbi:MAG: hypothetical protein ACI8UO_005445, partial [Verrucomicrobiales bacterium]
MSDTSTSTDSSTQQADVQGPDWGIYGDTVQALSAGTDVRPELLLAYMCSVLGGLAGPSSRLAGLLGEAHRPAQS